MKAWLVREKGEFIATVVFAETRGKAKVVAMRTEACEDVDFCNIEVRRQPQMDKYYVEGKTEMDWFNPNDRIALVKECGFYCEDIGLKWCEECPAKEYCEDYQDLVGSEDLEYDT